MVSPSKKSPTLADVGREAGVSSMAASAVLNNAKTSARISEPTRRKIIEAAKRLGYRANPNVLAWVPTTPRTHTIGVTLVQHAGLLNPYQDAVLTGILAGATEYEQAVTIFTLPAWTLAPGRIESFCERPIDGMILVAPVLSHAAVKALPTYLPMVAIHGNANMDGMVNLISDDEDGAYQATRHLIDLGHRRILHLTVAPEELSGSDARMTGWRRALVEAGLEHDPSLVVRCGWLPGAAQEATSHWLSSNHSQMPTGIFCFNDDLAQGCIVALAGRGLRVPDDISVVGFDNLPIARSTKCWLTTIAQPFASMGRQAVEALIEIQGAVEQTVRAPTQKVMPVSLVIGDSSGRPATFTPA